MDEEIPSRLCGRSFDEADSARIREEVFQANPLQRAETARRIC